MKYGIMDYEVIGDGTHDADMELPYEGAKEMILVDDVDDREFLRELVEAIYEELPASKKR